MAKHCTVCDQDYADDLAACPHCASAKKTHLAGRAEDRTTQLAGPAEDRTTQLAGRAEDRTTQLAEFHLGETPAAPMPSDSAIDLGAPPTSKPATGDAGDAGPGSGASEVAWSALVEEPHVEESKEIKIDSPSDAEILAHDTVEAPPETPEGSHEELVGELEAVEPIVEETATGAEAEVVELAGTPPQPMGRPSDSTVDLGGPLVEFVEDASGAVMKATASGESAVFMAELASDASRVDLVSDSGLALSEGEVVEVAGIDPVSGAEHIAPVEEIAVEEIAPVEEIAVEEVAALDVVSPDHESSAVDLGGTLRPSDASLSAEEVEEVAEVADGSGIDLDGLPVPGASVSDLHPGSESSVDLGWHAEMPAAPAHEEDRLEPVSESGIDLAGLGEPAPAGAVSDLALESLLSEDASSEAVAAEEAVEAEEEPVVAEDEPVAAEEAVEAEEEPVAAGASGLLGEETVTEESALAAVDEPVVSEEEVNDLLAGLEETPAEGEPGVTPEEAAEIAEGEEAIAAAEEEEAAEAAAEEEAAEMGEEEKEEEKPAKPAKQRSRLPALVGGTFLGILLGAGGLIGARFGGIDVPEMVGVGEKPKAPAPKNAVAAPQATFQALKAMVLNGDWEGAKKAGIDTAPANNPDELAARGDYRLGEYLKNAGNKINPQDPALQPALQDLQQAAAKNDPTAIYDLAWIKELAGQLPEARAEYAKGIQAFRDKPDLKEQFEAAIERVEWKAALKKGGEARLPLPRRMEDRALLLALLLMGLQQPPQPPQPAPQPGGQPPAAPKDDKEAGYEFWQAAKLAREGKFGDAIRALDRARKIHDQRRFSRLRKAQNPLSDPAEDIFLRCCDELKTYWQLDSRLRDDGYLTNKNTPPEALQALIQKAEASSAAIKDLTDKLVNAKVIGKDDDVSKGLDRLITDKKTADEMVADLTTKLKTATDDNTKLAADLKTTKKSLDERDTALTAAKDEIKKLTGDNEELNATLKKITTELAKARLLDPVDPKDPKAKPKIGEAVKKAIEVARIKDPQGMIRQQRGEIAQLLASLQQRWRPEEMLPRWLLLLDENRDRPELAKQATLDVERVKMDPRATPVQKGEAAIVLGLALRNAEKFDEAKMVLRTSKGAVDNADWLIRADAALREVSNPAAYFARQAQKLYDQGRMNAALAVLERAMKTLPEKEHGKLLAQRSLIELDAARVKTKGVLKPNDPLIVAANRDAAAAIKVGLAEGHYAAGRIAEALGQVNAAIKSYRAALAAHGDKLDAEGARYRMALARVLIMPRGARPAQPVMTPTPAGEKVGWRDPAPYPGRHIVDLKRMVLMLTFGLQAPLLPGEDPGLEEAEKQADLVLEAAQKNPGSIPFNLVAQALAIKGRWNVALRTYVEGIRPMLPAEYRNGLMYLILNHPRLKRPDSLRIPNPFEAERHYAAGLNFYFAREYVNAEQEFVLAVENDSNDARYFYFLGLSKLAQNRRRDAQDDFAQGAELEQVNRPAPAAVSESLERIQGRPRRIINQFRERP